MKVNTKTTCYAIITLCFILNCSTGAPVDNGKEMDKGGKIVNSITAIRQEIKELKDRVTNVEVKGVDKDKRVDSSITDATNHRKKRAITWRRRRRPEVAFQATLTKPSLTLTMLDNIIFNKVFTNIGSAYNKHNGIFTAPVTGTYMFNTNIVAETGHYVEASIEVNDEVVVSAISDHRVSADSNQIAAWDQGNAAAILRLKQGDKVAVSIQWPQTSIVIHGVGKSSFSGYLLRAYL